MSAVFLLLLLLLATADAGEPYVYVPFHPDLMKRERVGTPPGLLDNPDVAFYHPHTVHGIDDGYLRQLPHVLLPPARVLYI